MPVYHKVYIIARRGSKLDGRTVESGYGCVFYIYIYFQVFFE